MTQAPTILYTLGHGNRTLRELITLLHGAGVQTLVEECAVPDLRSTRPDHARGRCMTPYARRRNVVRTWVMREANSPSRRSL